jgi:hypothetical protein
MFIARGSGNQVVVGPSAEVLVPRPHVALEGHLAVDLELVHVQAFAVEQGLHRFHHARVAGQARERCRVQVRGEVRAHCDGAR